MKKSPTPSPEKIRDCLAAQGVSPSCATKFHAVVVSYVPLLAGEAGRSDLDLAQVGALMEQAPSGVAAACAWFQDEGLPVACLLYKGARELAVHLKAWAENQPEQWFNLAVAEAGPLYGLALVPRFQKGVERFRTAYQLRNGWPIPQDAEVQMLFKPLHFVSRPGHVFSQVRDQLGARCKVMLLETEDFRGADTDPDDGFVLGVFDVVREGPEHEYLVSTLEQSARDGNQ